MPHDWIHSAPDDFDDGLNECARAGRCSDPRIESAGGKTTRLPALTPRAFCDADRGAIAKALDDLPMLFVRVHMELGGIRAVAGGPVVSTSKSAPVPLSLAADELIRLILSTLTSWEERIRTVARLAALDTETSRRRRDGAILTQAHRILAAHLDALLTRSENVRATEMRRLRDEHAAQVHKAVTAARTQADTRALPSDVRKRLDLLGKLEAALGCRLDEYAWRGDNLTTLASAELADALRDFVHDHTTAGRRLEYADTLSQRLQSTAEYVLRTLADTQPSTS
ncbi:hypothetical protein SAMN05216275_11363 [Streptosporangium canum]|uniref:Uncharacterized protein n=1 Tax=Streptosporangium canum TaxID=324952 RepID=A0A1I3UUU6_9ACTN|nr:hypothetical protein [Streptosporangium canum]SFJ85601.1 hypothetical protein SAMN05216275_11363 [Streptosporangium canum]